MIPYCPTVLLMIFEFYFLVSITKFLYSVLSELRFKKGRNLAKFGESDMVPNFVAMTHMSDF